MTQNTNQGWAYVRTARALGVSRIGIGGQFPGEPGHGRVSASASTGDKAGAEADQDASKSMIPKKPAPDLIRGGYRFSEKHALGLDPGDHAPTIN